MMANAVTFEQAAEIGVMAVNAFGKQYEDLTYLFDVSQHVAQQTLLNIEDLQQGLQYAGSTAQLAGVEFEELVSMMGVLSQNAMVAGVASRSMNRMLLSIVEKAPEVQRWADSMGLGIEVIKDGKVNITEILPAFAKLDTSIETLQDSMDIFSIRGMRSWGILINNAEDYLRLLEESKASSGVLAETAKKQSQSIAYIWGRIRETLLTPFRTEEVRKQITATMEMFEQSMVNVGSNLQTVVADLVKEFQGWMPYFAPLLESIISLLLSVMNIAKKFVGFIAGLNKNILFTWLIIKMIQRLNIFAWLEKIIYQQKISNLQTSIAMRQENVVMLQMRTKTGKLIPMMIAAETEGIRVDNMKIEALQLKRQAYLNAGKAAMGVALGTMMLLTGMTREMKLMGALITTLNAVAMAYSIASAAKWSFMGGPLGTAAVVGGITAAVTGLYAYFSNIKEPEMPSIANMPSGYSTGGMGYEGFQRGATVITKPTLAYLHPGETVSSANKPYESGGIIINVQGDLIDHTAFFDRLEKELANRNYKRGRYYL
jgi:hypothetical protein